MPAAPLPPVLDEKLADLSAEVRRLLVVRGCGWLVPVVLGTAALALGLDAAFGLPGWVRGLMLVGWLALTVGLVWRLVVRPLREPVPPAALATQVERFFPGLAERLTTLVELHERAEPGNGSRALIGALARETDQRARRLDFSRVAPVGSAVGAAALAVLTAAALLTPLVFVGWSGERVRRFVLPWYTPPVEVPYRVVVSSGDPVVRRGEPVTLAAYLEPTRPDAPLPTSATLVVREPGAKGEKKLPMTGGEGAGFHLTRPGVTEDFEYCVEVGPARSDWHAVAVADPVTLADGTTLSVHPPRYAERDVPAQTREGFAEFDAVQFGRAELALKFSRPPAEAYLDWRPADPAGGDRARIPVRLEADRMSGTAEVPIPADGTLVLVLTGERNLRTELPAAVRAVPDAPPHFEKVAGLTGAARDARPDDRVRIELAAQDDIRLDSLVVEYRLNGNEADVRSEPVQIAGVGSKRAEGAFTLALAGKAKEGDTLLVRVRASDNRSVPEQKLGPQQAVFPPDGWAAFRITSAARPLAEQEVLAQRDRVKYRLAAAVRLVTEAAQEVGAVRAEAPPDGPPTVDQAVRLRTAREKTADATRQLEDLAAEAGLVPDLRPLAGAVRDVAEGPLRDAAAAVKAAETDSTKADRDKALATAGEKLTETLARLAALDARNEKTAEARLARDNLRQIADDQKALADDAGKSAAPPDELTRKERDLLARLNEAVARSGLLKGALDAAAGEELRDLLARARKLADDQAALNRAADQTDQLARKKRTEDLARRQRELAEQAAKLADRTATAARVAGTAPVDQSPFGQALERLTRGEADGALTDQARAAKQLDDLAAEFARAAAARGGRRGAARQVARWQDDLRRRLADAVRQAPGGRLPDDARKRFADEQQAVREAAGLLRETNPGPELAKAQDAARDDLKTAADALARKPADAPEAVKRAADALAKLADQLPTPEERAKQAKAQLDQLRKEQAAISGDAAAAVRGAPADAAGQKLDATAGKQDALAEKVRRLDLPGLEARRDTAADAGRRAAADLRSGLSQDIPASQHEVRRQLDRLRDALDGTIPPDEQADELARLQREVSDALAKLPDKPPADALPPLQRLQREVDRRLSGLPAPEAAGPLADAREAVRAADEALRAGDRPDELRKKTKDAADALARLTDRLSGGESDQRRVERLARERTAEAAQAKQAERQPANPEAAAEALRRVQRQLDELEQTRVGRAQAAKQKAVEALQRLQKTSDLNRRPVPQQAAADALRRLADEMARNGDRAEPTVRVGPPKPTDADELRRLVRDGSLPTDRDAEAARELARRQRELRDATAEAAAELARGVRPADRDVLGPLADEQDTLAKATRELAQKAPDASSAGKEQLDRAATATGQVADSLHAGSVESALKAGTDATGRLTDFAGQPDVPSSAAKEARELAAKQADLNARLAKLLGDPATEAARQRRRQDELAAETDRLAEGLHRAAEGQPGSLLGRAADAAGQARRQMDQAGHSADAGRATAAADARRQAGSLLGRAAADAQTAAKGAPDPANPDRDARAAGDAVRRAGDLMRRAESQLGRKNGTTPAAGSMRQAADALAGAVDGLGQVAGGSGGRPNGQPGPGGQQSGGNDGRPTAPATTDVTPADVAKYLSKPWGELPGDVKTKVIQELAARYGEDYARTIKLYFEQLADRK